MMGNNGALLPLIRDKYTISELVGTGSFANVYKATQKQSNTIVAIKSYKMDYRLSQERFRAASEMAFVKFLKHANIIKYISCDTTKSCMYLTIEFASKGTLLNYMPNREKLNLDQLQAVIRQLISALHYLHSLSILHGDIKPENILVTYTHPQMVIKLTDFGLAEIVDSPHPKNKTTGSYFYMAPELHLNFPYDLTADLYSAGVVMYELIYGQKPISATHKSDYTTILRKRYPIKYPSIDGISPDCMDLLKSLLCYDKHSRLAGQKLLDHNFLKIAPPNYTKINHYLDACSNFVKSSNFLKANNIGKAYIEAVEGFLQLKLYSNTVKNDNGMFQYLQHNMEKYAKYICKLDRIIETGEWYGNDIDTTMLDEKLRCMLVSTPSLLNAFDMCLVGNMYINQLKIGIGCNMLENGLARILADMAAEPPGERKRLLLHKIGPWVTTLETLKSHNLRPIISASSP